jgi:hypothetical protein
VDVLTVALWALRIAFLVCIYLVLVLIARALWRDLRTAVREGSTALGRLVVLRSPLGQPEPGLIIPLDAVTSLGRDVNSTVVIDDDQVEDDHALLTYRGWSWVLEDRTSGDATRVNGQPLHGLAVLGYGDVIDLGDVRFRLDRSPEAVGAP